MIRYKLFLVLGIFTLITAGCETEEKKTVDIKEIETNETNNEENVNIKDNDNSVSINKDLLTLEIKDVDYYNFVKSYNEKNVSTTSVISMSSLLLTSQKHLIEGNLDLYKDYINLHLGILESDKDKNKDLITIHNQNLKIIELIKNNDEEQLSKEREALIKLINPIFKDNFINYLTNVNNLNEQEMKNYIEFSSNVYVTQELNELEIYVGTLFNGREDTKEILGKKINSLSDRLNYLNENNDLVVAYQKLYQSILSKESLTLINTHNNSKFENEAIKFNDYLRIKEELYTKPLTEFYKVLNQYEKNSEDLSVYSVKRFELESMRNYVSLYNNSSTVGLLLTNSNNTIENITEDNTSTNE